MSAGLTVCGLSAEGKRYSFLVSLTESESILQGCFATFSDLALVALDMQLVLGLLVQVLRYLSLRYLFPLQYN